MGYNAIKNYIGGQMLLAGLAEMEPAIFVSFIRTHAASEARAYFELSKLLLEADDLI